MFIHNPFNGWFCFVYMKKPMVFFLFNEDRYNKEHYIKGYFDYRRDGLGPVVIDVSSVINELSNIVSIDYEIDSKYLSNID